MTVDIFLKSYRGDFKWLYFALKSIERNVAGYSRVILLIPENDKELFDTRNVPLRTEIHYVDDTGTGWLRQQWFKMTAHKYSYADFIMFSDSDVFFDHPINLQDYVYEGKPEILYTSWEKVDQAICWKAPTEKFMSEEVPFEFMRRLPLFYHRHTLVEIEKFQPDLENLIMSSERWSEFNCLGAWAYKNHRDYYKFTNTDDWKYEPPLGLQIWSHGKKDSSDPVVLKEYIRSLEAIIKSLGENPPA